MKSTTTTKKEIVDFLWEWTENNGEWSKLLISKIVSLESELSNSDRQSVFNYFLQSIDQHRGLPALTVTKPNYVPTSKQIELNSLSDVTGVNRLAKNQTITFKKNLTAIFGENGTGKTGYGRILKNLGFSKGNILNTHKDKLNEIFERCCGFIKGHSNPTEIHNDPTIAELKADFEDFKKIRLEFVN